jgi:hypothetical protein
MGRNKTAVCAFNIAAVALHWHVFPSVTEPCGVVFILIYLVHGGIILVWGVSHIVVSSSWGSSTPREQCHRYYLCASTFPWCFGGVGVKCHAVITLMVMVGGQNHSSATLPFTVCMLGGLLIQTVKFWTWCCCIIMVGYFGSFVSCFLLVCVWQPGISEKNLCLNHFICSSSE